MKKRIEASCRAVHFFFRILWRQDYEGRNSIAESLYCSGVIFDMWMDRLGGR